MHCATPCKIAASTDRGNESQIVLGVKHETLPFLINTLNTFILPP